LQSTQYPVTEIEKKRKKTETENAQIVSKQSPNHYLNWGSKKPNIVAKTGGSAVNYPIWLVHNTWASV
jgi:hypothetical protein